MQSFGTLPLDLTLSPPCSYGLLALFFNSLPFIIKDLQPLFTKYRRVGTPSLGVSHRANLLSSLSLMTSLQPPYFQAVPNSFAQRRLAYSPVFSDLRTLLSATGVGVGIATLGTS